MDTYTLIQQGMFFVILTCLFFLLDLRRLLRSQHNNPCHRRREDSPHILRLLVHGIDDDRPVIVRSSRQAQPEPLHQVSVDRVSITVVFEALHGAECCVEVSDPHLVVNSRVAVLDLRLQHVEELVRHTQAVQTGDQGTTREEHGLGFEDSLGFDGDDIVNWRIAEGTELFEIEQELRIVWKFHCGVETSGPWVREYYEVIGENNGIYYYIDSGDGDGYLSKLGRFEDDAVAISAGIERSGMTEAERAEIFASSEEGAETDE